jgi:hypothetical protein
MEMTDSDWNKALTGAGDREVIVNGDHTRVRYLVSDAIHLQAKAARSAGRPDKAGVLYRIAQTVSDGNVPAKGLMAKARKELETARKKTVDGKSLVSA